MSEDNMKHLPRTTVCTVFEIGSPRWNGNKGKIVGLNEKRLTEHNEIHFTYVRKSDGKLSIPDVYYFDGNLRKHIDFERQVIKGTTLVLVPFKDLKKLVRV